MVHHHGLLEEILPPERVFLMERASKDEVFSVLVEALCRTSAVRDAEEARRAILKREDRMSTSIGKGLAVPHARIPAVRRLVAALAVIREGVPDYETIDNKRVHVVCMILGHTNDHALYLRALGAIAARVQNPHTQSALLAAADTQTLYALLTAPSDAAVGPADNGTA
jgi:PTS system nitrogen regulatory IIA component